MLLIGKPPIPMGRLYHGYVSHNQRVNFLGHVFLLSESSCLLSILRPDTSQHIFQGGQRRRGQRVRPAGEGSDGEDEENGR